MKGEFEKRLREGLPDYFEQTEGENFITDALDEARKEFPRCIDCEFMVGDTEGNGHCTLDKEVEGKGCPKDDWFYRWFESEKKTSDRR